MSLPPRFYCPVALATGTDIDLPAGAARHVQVLRLQPSAPIVLFGATSPGASAGPGGEFDATVVEMGRSSVRVQVGAHHAVEREPARHIHLAIGVPANERMDWLIEKATELGAASVQALMTERTIVRLDGERARKRADHWHSIAVAACEQCGRNQVPRVPEVAPLRQWLAQQGRQPHSAGLQLLLSFRAGARPLQDVLPPDCPVVTVLAGPEGGLSALEEEQALAQGFLPVSLGPRVLRAETAAIAALTLLA
ncbi:MAG: 16S rRNA (uracil(1498)-N(3))-methyltransferase [Rhodoferax sp.]|nr:16S rRNA (uracil(1498)-N(3))-methyltransferase [Rhodoferax sp.]